MCYFGVRFCGCAEWSLKKLPNLFEFFHRHRLLLKVGRKVMSSNPVTPATPLLSDSEFEKFRYLFNSSSREKKKYRRKFFERKVMQSGKTEDFAKV